MPKFLFTMTKPDRSVHGVVRQIYEEMVRRNIRQDDLTYRAGIETSLFSRIRSGKRRGKIDDLEAAANVLGFTIKMVPIEAEPS